MTIFILMVSALALGFAVIAVAVTGNKEAAPKKELEVPRKEDAEVEKEGKTELQHVLRFGRYYYESRETEIRPLRDTALSRTVTTRINVTEELREAAWYSFLSDAEDMQEQIGGEIKPIAILTEDAE